MSSSEVSSLLCALCQTLVVRQDRMVWHDRSGWRMNISYTRHDSYPALPALHSSALAGCPVCDFLTTVIRRAMDRDNSQPAVVAGPATPLVLKLRQIEVSTMTRAREDTYPSHIDGELLVGDRCERLCIGFVRGGDEIRRYPSCDPLSDHAIGQIQGWLHECRHGHDACRVTAIARSPTRLLDVGSEPEKTEPRLILAGQRELTYAILSYCWGTLPVSDSSKSTKDNTAERLNRIPRDSLPRTIQDAIKVTRALGLRYIWIDSLCIVQDDPTDWSQESSKMMQYYEQAFVTIVATSAESVHHGFLHDRTKYLISKSLPYLWKEGPNEPLYLCEPRYTNTSLRVENALWNQRAWTFQERLLSRRLLHFTHTAAWFECRKGFCSDGWLSDRSNSLKARWLPEAQRELEHIRHEIPQRSRRLRVYSDWYRMIFEYSQRGLTFPKDKLPALAGVAQKLADYSGSEYVAGLWKDDLCRGIMWAPVWVSEIKRAETYRAPSWSWSSIDGGVYWPFIARGREGDIPCITIIHAEVSGFGTGPASLITGGKILLAGSLTRGSSLLPFHRRRGSWVRFDVEDKDEDEDNIDHYAKLLNPAEDKLWALPIMSAAPQTHNGLILESTGELDHGTAVYRRFGSFEIKDEADPKIVKAFLEKEEWVAGTVTII